MLKDCKELRSGMFQQAPALRHPREIWKGRRAHPFDRPQSWQSFNIHILSLVLRPWFYIVLFPGRQSIGIFESLIVVPETSSLRLVMIWRPRSYSWVTEGQAAPPSSFCYLLNDGIKIGCGERGVFSSLNILQPLVLCCEKWINKRTPVLRILKGIKSILKWWGLCGISQCTSLDGVYPDHAVHSELTLIHEGCIRQPVRDLFDIPLDLLISHSALFPLIITM